MKKKSLENFIRNAQIGHLTKDEYRDFQKKLITDRFLVEKVGHVLLQEDFGDLNREGIFNVFYRDKSSDFDF